MKTSLMRAAACFWLLAPLAFVGQALVSAQAERPFGGVPQPARQIETARNGRQVVRVGNRWLVAYPDLLQKRSFLAATTGKAKISLRDWDQFVFASLDGSGLFRLEAPASVIPSLAGDQSGRLHAAWTSGGVVNYARCDLSGAAWAKKIRQVSAWTGSKGPQPDQVLHNAFLGDLAVAANGDLWLGAVRTTGQGESVICLAYHAAPGRQDKPGGAPDERLGTRWKIHELARGRGYRTPVFHLEPDLTIHLAWADYRGQVFYQRFRQGQASQVQEVSRHALQSVYKETGHRPVVAANGREVVIAYETGYQEIQTVVRSGEKWQAPQRLTWADPRFRSDAVHSPQLALDLHGVIWLFFSDATRKHTYFSRWLGTSWSDIGAARGIFYRAPHFEANLLGSDWLCVERQPPKGANGLGMVLVNELAADRAEFHQMAVPAPLLKAGSSVLFLDLLETARWQGVEQVLNAAVKHPRNPLFTPGKPGSFDDLHVFNHGTVVREGKRFRMWYGGHSFPAGRPWWEGSTSGYAESQDGLSWSRVSAGGSLGKNNPLPGFRPAKKAFLDRPMVFLDPTKRPRPYKALNFPPYGPLVELEATGRYDPDSGQVPGWLLSSGDGIHWTSEPISMRFPGGKPWEFVPQAVFLDKGEPDPARRWKAYGWATPMARRRAPFYAFSPDAKHWTAYSRNPILDPVVSEVPITPAGPQNQVHDLIVWPYRGYYLALFQAQHDHLFLDLELAVSRDGEHFTHIKPGQKVIAHGRPGDWDWQQIIPSKPLIVDRQIWLYYAGLAPPPPKSGKLVPEFEKVRGCAGLATLRLDGFTYLQLKKGAVAGQLTTVAFQVTEKKPFRLALNADCSAKATITVEVLDARTGRPLPGYARQEGVPCQANEIRHLVRWRDKDVIQQPAGQLLQLRFWFAGRGGKPRLYACHVETP